MTLGLDWLMIGVWVATILLLVWLAWEPWLQTRRMVGIELPGDSRVRSPLFVFAPAVGLALIPFLAQLAPRPGVNAWLHPHLLMPVGWFFLAGFVVLQVGLRRAFLRVAQRRREELESGRKVFEQSAARSARTPRV